ncbi:cysteine desulfurase family protein [Mitsuokella sp.]|uniref:cysteine desulfurase family protein n=1 Tax=Mitsuokella sp. TaxID=2049034 RepID=UPI002A7F6FBB|nr:cysteine desulfurase family protein [Mitsuokella sp.]MDY4474538.1 cysteine desulfurase family protein [Mitsuokella sp.]
MKPVYLDYAATTPTDERVLAAMLPYFTQHFGNPSSLYSFGRETRRAVALARRQVAELLGASPEEIFFTSGGSESDNWLIKGVAAARGRGHIVTTAVEHHAVLRACASLPTDRFSVTYLPVDAKGRVAPEDVEAALRPDTILVSIMMANNEVGTIEPIAAIGAICRQQGILFHTDAVQAAGHLPIDVQQLQVDALSLSGHKLYGPKGIGALYLRRGLAVSPLICGGEQERSQRAGTENVPGIVGLGRAAGLAQQEMPAETERLLSLRTRLLQGVQVIPGVRLNGDAQQRLPGNVNLAISGVDQETLLIRLDLMGFAVSAGSACSAGSLEPSHVLLAMGQSPDEARSALRITLGRFTTEADVDAFTASLCQAVAEIRRTS